MNIEDILGSKASDTTIHVPVGKQANGEEFGFVVVGQDSDEYRQADQSIRAANIQQSALRKGEALDLTKIENAELAVQISEKHKWILLRACTVDWYGFTREGETGGALFSVDEFAKIIAARPRWGDKLLAAIESEENFTKG